MENWIRELRLAVRGLGRRPGFSLGIVGMLALGVAASVGLFSLVYSVLMRPLPFPHAGRIVQLQEVRLDEPDVPFAVSYLNAVEWHEASSFEHLTLTRPGSVVLSGVDQAVRLPANFVTPAYFSLFGAELALGRTFDHPGALPPNPVQEAVLSHALWQSMFGGDPAVLGSTIRVGGLPVVVVGVVEPGFGDPFAGPNDGGPESGIALFLPVGMAQAFQDAGATMFEQRQFRWFTVLARLAPGTSIEAAGDELDAVQARLAQAFPDANGGFGGRVVGLQESLSADIRGPVLLLLTGALVLLAVACFNVANLLLVRGASRQHEVALRQALGAGKGALLRQFAVEASVLAVGGGVVGVALAYLALEPLLAASPTSLPSAVDVTLDGPVLAAALALTLATGLAFGVVPALRGLGANPRSGLSSGDRAGRPGSARRLQDGLVMAEVAVAMTLLVASAMAFSGFDAVRGTGPGFRTERVLTARVDLPPSRYATPETQTAFVDELRARLAARPELEWAHVWAPGRPGQTFWAQTIVREGQEVAQMTEAPLGRFHIVSPGAIEDLGMTLVAGRLLDEGDVAGSVPVAVINRSMAEELWPGESPLGKRFRRFQPADAPDSPGNPWFEVVGVVAAAPLGGRLNNVGQLQTSFDLFNAYPQRTRPNLTVVVGTRGEAGTGAAPVRDVLRELDPDMAVYNLSTMEQHLADEEGPLRFASGLLGAFGVTALLLAALGVYGVLAFSVSERRREIGVRAALGAERGQTIAMFLKRGVRVACGGVAGGVALSWWVGEIVGRNLVGVEGLDVVTVAVPAAVLVAVAGLASWLPARRAASVAPVEALRRTVAVVALVPAALALSGAPAELVAQTPELFAPGHLSLDDRNETFPAIDPVDGSFWFSTYDDDFDAQTIHRALWLGERWGEARVVPFSGRWGDRAVRFAPRGERFYFTSNRPLEGATEAGDMNLWVAERRVDLTWAEPRPFDPANTTAPEMHASVDTEGRVYFASRRAGSIGRGDIYRTAPGGAAPAEHLPPPINDEHSQPDLLIGPGGFWMILVVTDHPDGRGGDDLFLVERGLAGWGEPMPLPGAINSEEYEYGPWLSRDGAWLYFTSHRRGSADIWRVRTEGWLPRAP